MTIIRLVPKNEPDDAPVGEGGSKQVANAIEACQLALDTLQGYTKTREAAPNKVIIMLCSDDVDGSARIEYVTANLGHFAMVGMIETVKDEIQQARRG